MNITLPQNKLKKSLIFAYIIILIICVLAIGVAVYQFFSEERLGLILGITDSTDEEYEKLKANFENIFNNTITGNLSDINVTKIDDENNIVYTGYEKKENSLNDYDVDVHIPYINIENETIQEFNEEIQSNFEKKVESILQTEDKNIICTIEYRAVVENNTLSLIIRCNLKEGTNAQRLIIQTYNYDLVHNREVTLEDFLRYKSIEKNVAQVKIKEEINKSYEQAEELRELGYNIFSRESNDDMYKIENTTEYCMFDNYLYIIYAYGNKAYTTEKDVIVF